MHRKRSSLDGHKKRQRLADYIHQQREESSQSSNSNNSSQQQQNEELHKQNHQCEQFIGRKFPPQVRAFTIAKMDVVCSYCQALCFPNEPKNCCHNGKVLLPSLNNYPPQLRELLTKNDEQSRSFIENI